MMGTSKVFGSVFVFRGVAATHVPAGKTKPQVDPGVAQFHTLFAFVFIGGPDLDLIGVFASHIDPLST
jgi:hypothetical protein